MYIITYNYEYIYIYIYITHIWTYLYSYACIHFWYLLISMLHGLFGAKHRIWGEIALPDGSSPSSTGQLWCGAPDACLFCLAVAVAFLTALTVVQTVFGFCFFFFLCVWSNSNIARIVVSFLCNLRGRQAKGGMMLVKVKELWCRVACNHDSAHRP